MSQTAKKTNKKRANPGLITSLHVTHPSMLKRIRAAAKLTDQSVSKFLLAAGDKEAARMLGGRCPACGQPMKATKPHGHGTAKKAA